MRRESFEKSWKSDPPIPVPLKRYSELEPRTESADGNSMAEDASATVAPPTVLEVLSAEHDVASFCCGSKKVACAQIDEFIQKRALHAQNVRENETFILRYATDNKVRAYITLASGSFSPREMDKKLKVPGWEIPVTGSHIAYVGTDASVKGGGFGKHLIDWAINRAAENPGIRLLHLFAYPDMVTYYEQGFGFKPFGEAKPDETKAPRQLMIYDVLAAIKEAEGKPIQPLAPVPLIADAKMRSHKADHAD